MTTVLHAEPALAPASGLRIGGITPFSGVDWPGQLSAVVFVQGCPWRCGYCHNPHLQARAAEDDGCGAAAAASRDPLTWDAFDVWLLRRRGLIDAVVFSGGEPTIDPALPATMAHVRDLGFRVGLHTAGIYPRRLEEALVHADWVGFDVKASLARDEAAGAAHDRVTGTPRSAAPVRRSLELLLASGVDFECRTTAHPALLDDAALLAIGDELAAAGVARWALQIYRNNSPEAGLPAVPGDYPAAPTLAALAPKFEHFTLRR